MLCFGATLLTIGAISTLAQPKLRDINITLLSVGGACTLTAIFIKSLDLAAESFAEITPVQQDKQEIIEAQITRVTVRDKTRTTYIERKIVRLTRAVRR
ncbi:hypothetical protein CAL7716_085890 [Calothrix sp. PCC 7716]|nr:hypothetical protein CAL7716_085890 [Calothrix sp. PCC 7716]